MGEMERWRDGMLGRDDCEDDDENVGIHAIAFRDSSLPLTDQE